MSLIFGCCYFLSVWHKQPFLRRLITRCISLVPSVIVAASVGRGGITTLLVASQVVLSVVLPFVAFPLIYLTSSEKVMRVRAKPLSACGSVCHDEVEEEKESGNSTPVACNFPGMPEPRDGDRIGNGDADIDSIHLGRDDARSEVIEDIMVVVYKDDASADAAADSSLRTVSQDPPSPKSAFIDFSNGRLVNMISYAVWCVVLVANVYAIVMLLLRANKASS